MNSEDGGAKAPVDAMVSLPEGDSGDTMNELSWLASCEIESKRDVAERFGVTEDALS